VSPVIQRGRLLERVRRFGEAEIEFRRAVVRDPRHPMALAAWQILPQPAALGRATKSIEPTCSFRAGADRCYPGLGQCLDRLNRLQEAVDSMSVRWHLTLINITALGYRGRLCGRSARLMMRFADFSPDCLLEPGNAGSLA